MRSVARAPARPRKGWKMKRCGLSALVVMLSAMGVVVSGVAVGAAGRSDLVKQDELAPLRQATMQYHDVRAAEDSGRVDLSACVDHMGQHWANPSAIFGDQGALDPLDPEAMVYADDGKGHLRLVAVEWISPTPGFVGDKPLHLNKDFGLYILHAWIWSANPDGMFADMNPLIGDCP
jgi:hypothetical protein